MGKLIRSIPLLLIGAWVFVHFPYRDRQAAEAKIYGDQFLASFLSTCDREVFQTAAYLTENPEQPESSIEPLIAGCKSFGQFRKLGGVTVVAQTGLVSLLLERHKTLVSYSAEAEFSDGTALISLGITRTDGPWRVWGLQLAKKVAAFGVYSPAK